MVWNFVRIMAVQINVNCDFRYRITLIQNTFAINGRGRERWHSVDQNGSIATLEEHTQFPPQVPHCLPLLYGTVFIWLRIAAEPFKAVLLQQP